jgi:SAM-dependent methyltransferase
MYGKETKSHLGGYWNVKNVWGDPGTWSPEIWNTIIKKYNIESVADIGCGLGYATRYFSQKGLYAVGVEGGINAINNSVFEGNIINNDYTKSSAFNRETEEYDLIWCCEFVEHVEEQFADNFLNDFSVGQYVAMTFADVGQEGYHHVNCQHEEYWIKKLEEIGFKLNRQFSAELRDIAIKTRVDPVFPHGTHLRRILFFEKG